MGGRDTADGYSFFLEGDKNILKLGCGDSYITMNALKCIHGTL